MKNAFQMGYYYDNIYLKDDPPAHSPRYDLITDLPSVSSSFCAGNAAIFQLRPYKKRGRISVKGGAAVGEDTEKPF